MQIEYEATFTNVNKDAVRKKLKTVGAKLIKKEFLQKRIPFHLPKEKRAKNKFVRVRNEGDKITLTYKHFNGKKIENQKEINLRIDNFENAVEILKLIGCEPKQYQETKREIWELKNVEIMIDEWPFLEPLVEIEGKSETEVKKVSKKLGFDYSKALFCSAGELYETKYGFWPDDIKSLKKLVFNMKNPFLEKK